MKKFIVLMALFMAGAVATSAQAQKQAEEDAQTDTLYAAAVQALKENRFVMEADKVVFKYGDVAFVNSNTNFVLVNGKEGTVQVAFNTPFAGPNGIGGITVDGMVSGVKQKENKTGKMNYSFNVQGSAISAQVFILLSPGSNQATVNISPNFNSRTLTLYGKIVPLEESTIYKARAL